MKMCHMVATNMEELHEMAQELGLRRYFQGEGRYPHYDISMGKRRTAVALGAVEVSEREIIRIVKGVS